MKGSFFSLGLTNSATKLNSWLSHRLSSSPSRRSRSARFMSPKRARMFLMCESSYSAAVLQSGTRCVGVGLGAGVGGDAGADGRRLCGLADVKGLVGVLGGPGSRGRRCGRGGHVGVGVFDVLHVGAVLVVPRGGEIVVLLHNVWGRLTAHTGARSSSAQRVRCAHGGCV
jgi:hypothetical protein